MRGVKIGVDGLVEVVDQEWDYDQMSEAVGGFIEAVSLAGGDVLWVNEDGIAMELPVNLIATALARTKGHPEMVLVGPAFVLGHRGPDNDEVSDASIDAAETLATRYAEVLG